MSVTPPVMADPALRYSAKRVVSTAPRALVKVMGIQAVPIEAEITHNAHGVMDTANFKVAQPGGIDWSDALKDPASNDDAIVCEIYAGFPTDPTTTTLNIAQLNQRFIGVLDKNGLSCRGGVWSFECSSLASLLLSEKQITLIQGQTTKQYLEAVAKSAGLLTSIVAGPNGFAPITQVFAREFVVGIHTVHPWAILQACAATDDMDLWLRGNTIYYWTPYAVPQRKHVIFQYGQDLLELELEHDPQTKADVQVITYSEKVRTSHSVRVSPGGTAKTSDRVTVTVPKFGTAGSETITTSANGGTNVSTSSISGGAYKSGATTIAKALSREALVYHIPNLTPQQAQNEANIKKEQLSRSEYQATFDFPVTPEILPLLNIETIFELYGCPATVYNTGSRVPLPSPGAGQSATTFTNSGYFQRQLQERFSLSEGWRAKATCLNHGTPQGAEENAGAGVL